jgi:DNA-binding Lrp family transcriptional regulator
MQPSPFDNLDYQIIQELRHNVRADAAKIARAIGANERTVRNRIDQLINREAVKLTTIINPRAFGYVTIAEVFLEVDPEHEEEVLQRLLSMQEVAYIAYAYGEDNNDLSLRARFKDNDELRDFLRRTLPSIEGVKVKNAIIVPRILRVDDEWMPKPEDFGADAAGGRGTAA